MSRYTHKLFQAIIKDRILNDPSEQGGIDAAITYLHGKEAALLAEARRRLERRDEEERRARAALRSLLIAAGAAASEARPAEAERLFDRVLETDPDWPEALMAAGWFYRDRALFEDRHGTLAAALLLARKALSCAERLNADPPVTVKARRFQAAAELQMADILVERGQPGDAEQALAHYQRGLEVAERLLADNPRSAEAARDLLVSLERMSAASAAMDDPDTAAKALDYQAKALEIAVSLHQQNPGSLFFARTAAVSFLLTSRRAEAAGEAELAQQSLAECVDVLHQAIEAGLTFDPPIMQLYQQLRETFGSD